MAGRQMTRGDVWMYAFKRPDKRRPALVLSRDDAIRVLRTVMVAPITSTIHGLPSEVLVGTAEKPRNACEKRTSLKVPVGRLS
jgi:mRNA interferase MazF